jgi:hypothetical protein
MFGNLTYEYVKMPQAAAKTTYRHWVQVRARHEQTRQYETALNDSNLQEKVNQPS